MREKEKGLEICVLYASGTRLERRLVGAEDTVRGILSERRKKQ